MKKGGTFLLLGLTIAFVGVLVGMLIGRNMNTQPATIHITTKPTAAYLPADTSSAATDAKQLININTASKEVLDALPGIGPVLAERIVQYRQDNGPFQQVSDLSKVEGIGNEKLLGILDLITVED